MLVNLNAEIYELKLEILQISGMVGPELQILKGDLDEKLSLRIWMVLGEGAVFVTILLLGFWSVRKSIIKELKLAEQQKNFLLSVTHELKSPLAAVKLQLQTLNSRQLSDEQRKQLYLRALNDSDRLEKLVENLLLVNKVESGRLPLDKVVVDLNQKISILLKDHYVEHLQSGMIVLDGTGSANVECDPMALQSIIINLLDNAIKYGNGSNIDVAIVHETNKVDLRVADRGIGIPGKEKQKVFERFYRIGNEEVRKTKGTGIGLYLVKILVEQHGGTIRVEDNKPRGAVFVVTLPSVED